MNKKRDWFSLLDIFLGGIIFISLCIIIIRYGVYTAFFKFENLGVWEKIVNVGVFYVLGYFCLNQLLDGISKLFPKKNNKKKRREK